MLIVARDIEIAQELARSFPGMTMKSKLIIGDTDCRDESSFASTFEKAYEFLLNEGSDRFGQLPIDTKIRILIDEIEPDLLHPFSHSFSGMISMLILAFPEIHWVLSAWGTPRWRSVVDGAIFPEHQEEHLRWCEIVNLHGQEQCKSVEIPEALFDGSGLRDWIYHCASESLKRDGIDPHLPCRWRQVIAVDDEKTYSYLHAYTAYRFGLRAYTVTSLRCMKYLLDQLKPYLVLEDLYLNFPDKPCGEHLSALKLRDVRFPVLKTVPLRVLVTSGHTDNVSIGKWDENVEYFNQLKEEGQWNNYIHKPFAGIFDLWERTGLKRKIAKCDRDVPEGKRFIWPPKNIQHPIADSMSSHSAQGRLLAIAVKLVSRVQGGIDNVKSVEDGVHRAVLATIAMELLGDLTPTTALEALSLKHRAEVLAECQFQGVEHNLNMPARFEDIHGEVKAIGRSFNKKSSKICAMNAELAIVSNLTRVFREYNQFDEEQQCLVKTRSLHRRIWVRRRRPFSWVINPFSFYLEYLLRSPRYFLGAITLWILLLTGFYETGVVLTRGEFEAKPFLSAMGTFFAVAPPSLTSNAEFSPFGVIVVAIGIIAGFVHLGVFITYVYAIISRR